jgi:hypothetical protein
MSAMSAATIRDVLCVEALMLLGNEMRRTLALMRAP